MSDPRDCSPALRLPHPSRCEGGESGIVFDIKRYAIHDGPGIRTTVFLKGCPLRCAWCHNPESWRSAPETLLRSERCEACGACIEVCPTGALSPSCLPPVPEISRCIACGQCAAACGPRARRQVGRRRNVEEVVREVERDVVFYDCSGGGATFSGGEPLLQWRFLRRLLRACREREIHTALDTCLHAPWEVVEEIAPWTDLFLCDLKHPDPETHRELTGAGNERIIANLARLARLGRKILVRIPVVPGVNNSPETIRALADLVLSLPGPPPIELLAYHSAGRDKAEHLTREVSLIEPSRLDPLDLGALARELRVRGLTVKANQPRAVSS